MTRRDTARRFYAPPESLALPAFRFPPEEEHHIYQVLRIGRGAEVVAVDGMGNAARVVLAGGDDRLARVIDRFPPERVAPFHLTLATALLRGSALDDVVERCTELGVLAFQPFVSARTVPAPSAVRSEKRLARYRKLALSAMKLAQSATCPEIMPTVAWNDLLRRFDKFDVTLICDGASARPLRPPRPDGSGRVLLLIGPEGGWTEEEVEDAVRAGAVPVHLGPRNLRASTAASAAAALALSAAGPAPSGGLR